MFYVIEYNAYQSYGSKEFSYDSLHFRCGENLDDLKRSTWDDFRAKFKSAQSGFIRLVSFDAPIDSMSIEKIEWELSTIPLIDDEPRNMILEVSGVPSWNYSKEHPYTVEERLLAFRVEKLKNHYEKINNSK